MLQIAAFVLLLYPADPHNVAIAERFHISPVCALAAEVCTYLPIWI